MVTNVGRAFFQLPLTTFSCGSFFPRETTRLADSTKHKYSSLPLENVPSDMRAAASRKLSLLIAFVSSFQVRSSLLVVADYFYYYYSSITESFGSEVVPKFLEKNLPHLWQQLPQDVTGLAAIHRWLKLSMEFIPLRDACIDCKACFFPSRETTRFAGKSHIIHCAHRKITPQMQQQ